MFQKPKKEQEESREKKTRHSDTHTLVIPTHRKPKQGLSMSLRPA